MRRALAFGGVAGVCLAGWCAVTFASRLGVHKGYAPEQPIAFPHKVHAGDNRIPCLYCHYGARTSRHAGIPPVGLCSNCHSMLEKRTVDIEKVREAIQIGRPVAWVKVHNLPDFVYFNHSRHVLSGVECRRCHGDVEKMDRVEQMAPLTMGWCLDCHRQNAHVPTEGFRRAVSMISKEPVPSPGLDCASCHF